MAIEWRREMAVDGAVIDDDHIFLIEIINTYDQAMKKAGSSLEPNKIHALIFKVLEKYTIQHFERNCPPTPWGSGGKAVNGW